MILRACGALWLNSNCPKQIFVRGWIDEARIRITMHQCVNLQLSLVKSVLRRGYHIAIDDVTNPRVEAYLKYCQRMMVSEVVCRLFSISTLILTLTLSLLLWSIWIGIFSISTLTSTLTLCSIEANIGSRSRSILKIAERLPQNYIAF